MNDKHSGSVVRRDVEPSIEALCHDRPQEETEIFAPNAWYGAARIVRQVSGWPAGRPLPLVLPHGVELSPDFVNSGEVENRLPAIFSFPAHRDEAYRAAANKRVIPGCSPWLYIPRPATRILDRATILMMPAHSSIGIAADMDDDRFAQVVRQRYPGEDLQCCMYWRDVQLGRQVHYLRREIPVVSAGHIFDSRFFERLAALFTTARLMVTNEFGSHVFYAASHDVPVVVLTEVGVTWVAPDDMLSRYCAYGPFAPAFEKIAPHFQQASPDITLQRPAAERMLGAERALGGAQLRDLLEDLWRTPGFRSRVVPRWHVSRRIAPARSLLRRLLG